MASLAWYEKADGEAVPFPEREDDMTPEERAFILLSRSVGMRRLDSDTIDEFVRRIELYQTYFTTFVYDENGPVILGRKDMLDMLGDRYTAAWTAFSETSTTKFDAAVKKEKAASEVAAARRRENGS